MGVIALSGVVVNDSLIMIDHANKHRGDLSAYDAIHEAGIRRFSPIILTTITTFGGHTYYPGNIQPGLPANSDGYIFGIRDRICNSHYFSDSAMSLHDP
jgi:hypothetical protein